MSFINQIICGETEELIPQLDDNSIDLVVTSPPYAEQRAKYYSGVNERDYPNWFLNIMDLLKPKMKDNASVLVVIRPHINKGEISDYVLKTRLKIRESGWKECEELIWSKPDAPPLGSIHRPRRVWEKILWFCKTTSPYVDLTACGNYSNNIGFRGSGRFGTGHDSPVSSGPKKEHYKGKVRVGDMFISMISEISRDKHPAMFPFQLPRKLIKTFSPLNGVVLDPFVGSGTTAVQAKALDRRYIGFDNKQEYVDISIKNIRQVRNILLD